MIAKKITKENVEIKKSKKLDGIVVSDKMTDTIVVSVSRYFKHPKYGKFISKQKKYKAHDAGNTAHIGDKVEIVECRPISKDKHFKLSQILIKKPIVNLDNE
jgi:small subunit ribosomal protein S17